MNTVQTVKQRLIDYLASVDLSKLSMMDLSGYACVIGQLQSIERREDDLMRLAGFGCSILNDGHKREMN